jgi:hypothetical protein
MEVRRDDAAIITSEVLGETALVEEKFYTKI